MATCQHFRGQPPAVQILQCCTYIVHILQPHRLVPTLQAVQLLDASSAVSVVTMAILLALSTCIIAWTAWQAISFAKSYGEACAIGLPIVVCPWTSMNPLWMVANRVRPIRWLCEQLPYGLGRGVRYSCMGWQYEDKDAAHREFGPAFVLCTPGMNEVHLADPDAVKTVLRQRKEFVKPGIIYGESCLSMGVVILNVALACLVADPSISQPKII